MERVQRPCPLLQESRASRRAKMCWQSDFNRRKPDGILTAEIGIKHTQYFIAARLRSRRR
jgi:hypothetical protein